MKFSIPSYLHCGVAKTIKYMQVIPFAANFEVAASVRCSPKIISLGNFTHTVCYAFYWFVFFLNFFCYFVRIFFFGWTRLDWTVSPAGNRTSAGRGFGLFPARVLLWKMSRYHWDFNISGTPTCTFEYTFVSDFTFLSLFSNFGQIWSRNITFLTNVYNNKDSKEFLKDFKTSYLFCEIKTKHPYLKLI